MAKAPAGAASKPVAPGKAQGKPRGNPAPGRGRAQPAAPGRCAPAPGAKADKEAADEPTLAAAAAPVKAPAEQPRAAQASSGAQPARKGGVGVQQDTSADRAARLRVAANGKRKSQLTPQMERSRLQIANKAKPSGSSANPSDETMAYAPAEDTSEGAAQDSLPAADAAAEGPEPQMLSVQVSADEDGAAKAPEEGPSGQGTAQPAASSAQQSSQLTPPDRRLSGLGGSCLPLRSPSSSKGQSKRPRPSASISSPPNKRAKAPAGPPAVDSNGQATAASTPAEPSASEGG